MQFIFDLYTPNIIHNAEIENGVKLVKLRQRQLSKFIFGLPFSAKLEKLRVQSNTRNYCEMILKMSAKEK